MFDSQHELGEQHEGKENEKEKRNEFWFVSMNNPRSNMNGKGKEGKLWPVNKKTSWERYVITHLEIEEEYR